MLSFKFITKKTSIQNIVIMMDSEIREMVIDMNVKVTLKNFVLCNNE
jgi:hypothetical protein